MVGIVSLQIITTINFMFDDVHHWGACAKSGEWKQAIALLQELLEVKNLELDVALRWKFRKLMVLLVLNLGAWCGVPMGTLDLSIFQRRFSNVNLAHDFLKIQLCPYPQQKHEMETPGRELGRNIWELWCDICHWIGKTYGDGSKPRKLPYSGK